MAKNAIINNSLAFLKEKFKMLEQADNKYNLRMNPERQGLKGVLE